MVGVDLALGPARGDIVDVRVRAEPPPRIAIARHRYRQSRAQALVDPPDRPATPSQAGSATSFLA